MTTQRIDPAELMVPLVEEVERQGQPPHLVSFRLANEDSDDFGLLLRHFPDANPAAIQTSLGAARANEYMVPTSIGPGASFRLTTRGFYAGKSQRQAAERIEDETNDSVLQADRDRTRKINDWLVANMGLVAGATLVVAIIGMVLALG